MQNTPRKIIVHHSAADAPDPQFLSINEWHKERGFTLSELGFYVGYHYVIEKDGSLKTARREDEIGCHTIGQNESSIGICLVGNFDVSMPTNAQIATLGDMLTSICARYRLDESEIYPHRTFAAKSCYGKKLSNHWAALVYLQHEQRRIEARIDALPTD